MADTDSIDDGAVTPGAALTFLGRPLGRFVGTVDTGKAWG
jgi:hypothetical protein